MIDTSNPCAGRDNWRASVDPSGGTPGRENSVAGNNPDTTAPEAVRVLYLNPNLITVEFSEPFPPGSLPGTEQFSIAGITEFEVLASEEGFNLVDIVFAEPLNETTLYQLTVDGSITDCAGNSRGMEQTLPFGVPQLPEIADVVINEILFNPVSGNVDFVELYNRSQKIIDLADLRIGKGNPDFEDQLDETQTITNNSFVLLPGEYVALSESPDLLLDQYFSENPNALLDINNLPSYNDADGVVALAIFNGEICDRVAYDEKWHHPLIDDEDGVSLERIDFDGPSQDPNNWQSAARSVGFATPGYKNSNFIQGSGNMGLSVNPVFSPDQDGFEDFSFLQYNLERAGFSAAVKIYNDRGLPIKTIANSEPLSVSGTLKWDGSRDDGTKAVIGKYIWLVELFHPDGETIEEKFVVTLTGQLE